MRKLTALVDHLLAASGLAREQANAFADEGTLLPTGRHLGFVMPEPCIPSLGDAVGAVAPDSAEGASGEFTSPDICCAAEAGKQRQQLEVGVWSYEGVIQLERYPFDGPTLLSHVLSWLADHDAERQQQDVKDPKVTLHINDAHTCDVEIAVEFEEALTVVECFEGEEGSVLYQGKRWRLAAPDMTPAEKLAGMKGRIRE